MLLQREAWRLRSSSSSTSGCLATHAVLAVSGRLLHAAHCLHTAALRPPPPAAAAAAAAAPSTPTEAAAAAADEHFMRLALAQAQAAFDAGEVPVGAVLVMDSQVVAAGHNSTEGRANPLSHAEMLCIAAAAEQQLAWRLQEATLYSTLEPCPMCAGAILQARLARLVYGARQPRVGADGSWVALFPPQEQQQQLEGASDQQQQQLGLKPEEQEQEQRAVCPDPCQAGTQPLPWQQEQQQLVVPPQQQQQQMQQQEPAHMQPADDTHDTHHHPHPHPHHDQEQQQQQQQQGQVQGLEPAPAPAAALQPRGPHPFHPRIRVTHGVLRQECADLMVKFFRRRRQQREEERPGARAGEEEAARGGAGGGGGAGRGTGGDTGKFGSAAGTCAPAQGQQHEPPPPRP